MNTSLRTEGREDVQWTIVQQEFDEMLAMKKESARGPDGILKSIYRCAGVCPAREVLFVTAFDPIFCR